MANEKCFPFCAGTLGDLVVDTTYKAGISDYHIDLLVLDLANAIYLTDNYGIGSSKG
jgi:hypothetical protein